MGYGAAGGVRRAVRGGVRTGRWVRWRMDGARGEAAGLGRAGGVCWKGVPELRTISSVNSSEHLRNDVSMVRAERGVGNASAC